MARIHSPSTRSVGPGALEDRDGGPRCGGAALDPPVDVLAAHHERTDRVDHDGLVMDAVVIEPGHPAFPPVSRLSQRRAEAPRSCTHRARTTAPTLRQEGQGRYRPRPRPRTDRPGRADRIGDRSGLHSRAPGVAPFLRATILSRAVDAPLDPNILWFCDRGASRWPSKPEAETSRRPTEEWVIAAPKSRGAVVLRVLRRAPAPRGGMAEAHPSRTRRLAPSASEPRQCVACHRHDRTTEDTCAPQACRPGRLRPSRRAVRLGDSRRNCPRANRHPRDLRIPESRDRAPPRPVLVMVTTRSAHDTGTSGKRVGDHAGVDLHFPGAWLAPWEVPHPDDEP